MESTQYAQELSEQFEEMIKEHPEPMAKRLLGNALNRFQRAYCAERGIAGVYIESEKEYSVLIDKENKNLKRVSKDDLRAMLDCNKWSKQNEEFVLRTRDFIIVESLLKGFDIIVDDTNLHEKNIKRFKEIAENYNADLIINDSFLEVDIQECIKRDLKRQNRVGEKVRVS